MNNMFFIDNEIGRLISEDEMKDICESKRETKSDYKALSYTQIRSALCKSGEFCQVKNLCVCDRCLQAIQSREGRQKHASYYVDDDPDIVCEWCGEQVGSYIYELL